MNCVWLDICKMVVAVVLGYKVKLPTPRRLILPFPKKVSREIPFKYSNRSTRGLIQMNLRENQPIVAH